MKRTTLTIAPSLQLPLEAVTETFAILAKRGKGKTYTANVMAEEMLEAGQQIVVLDPMGVWWGLRAGADGDASGGLPVTILGGKHADLPLEPTAGKVVADLVVDQGLSVVLDLKGWSKSDMRRFVADFGEQLYKRNENPLHVFIDEADLFAHQRLAAGDERMFGAVDNLVRRGRSQGVGVTLITQRAAVLNKDVLTQAEVLVCMGMTGTPDRKAVEEWVKYHGDEDAKAAIMEDLAKLDVGEAWIYSPGWLETFKKVKVRKRRTFDSSATPKVGKRVVPPKELRKVDLEKLREQLVQVVEKAKEDDPATLRARIRELEKSARSKLGAKAPASVDARDVERAVAAATKDLQVTIARLQRAGQEREKVWEKWRAGPRRAVEKLAAAATELGAALATPPAPFDGFDVATAAAPARASTTSTSTKSATTSTRTSTTRSSTPASTTSSRPRSSLSPKERVLQAMAQLRALGQEELDKDRVAIFAGYERGGSTMRGIFAALSKEGLVEYPRDGHVQLTAAGAAAAPAIDAPVSFDELRATLERERLLGAAQLAAFDLIARAYPNEVSKDELAAALDHEPGGSTQRGILARLRALGLLEKNGIKACEWVFEGGS